MLTKKVQLGLVIFLLTAFISGCAAVSPSSVAMIPKYREGILLKKLCQRHNVIWQWDSLSQIVTLRRNDISARVLVDSNIVLIGEEKVRLKAPVRMVKSSIEVPPDFKQRVIDRLTKVKERKVDYSFKKVRSIIIDAGHGGKDPGAIGRTGLKEKGIVLDIARRLKKVLQRHGLKVNMIRDKDEFISLKKRTDMASSIKADLFISIHANSNPVRGIHGVEVYYSKDLGPLEKKDVQRRVNHHRMFRNLSMKKGSSGLERMVEDMLYTHKQTESPVFAASMAKRTAGFARTKNLGIKSARFYVLRNTLIPAVLVEVGFLSNFREEKLLKTGAYREKITNGLAKGILEYIKNE